jgi:hypothetical protein
MTQDHPMIDFYVLRTVGSETRRIPVPVGIATDDDAVQAYVTHDDAWTTGEVVAVSWPSPLSLDPLPPAPPSPSLGVAHARTRPA